MKKNEKKSTNHQPATQKPFFGAAPDHAFFSPENAQPTPFFQPKAVLLALAPYSEEEKQQYLGRYGGNFAGAMKVLNWVHNIATADKIMKLNPDTSEVDQVRGLNKLMPDLLALIMLPAVTTVPQLISLANSVTNRNTMEDKWQKIDDDWWSLVSSWNHWQISGIIQNTQQTWNVASLAVRQATRGGEPDEAQIQAFLIAKSQMEHRMAAINAFIPVLDKGQDNLVLAGQKLQEANQLLQTIDKLLIYYHTPGQGRATIEEQKQNVLSAIGKIHGHQQSILGKQINYNQRAAIDQDFVVSEIFTQNGYNAELRFGIHPSIPKIRNTLNPYTNPQFEEASQYGNLNLTSWAAQHQFWKSLNPEQKAKLNQKLNGFTPSAWEEEGHPQSRDKQNGYTGLTILIPTLTGGFPLRVSGEIVHDWIFETKDGHGHSAQKMNQLVTLALANKRYQAAPGFFCQPIRSSGNPETFTWKNLELKVVVANGKTLITYYNTL